MTEVYFLASWSGLELKPLKGVWFKATEFVCWHHEADWNENPVSCAGCGMVVLQRSRVYGLRLPWSRLEL